MEQLKRNNANYERIINEKKSKQQALEKQTYQIRNGGGIKMTLEDHHTRTIE